VPIAVKDLYATRGVRTTCGSRILADRVPAADADAVERLRRGGAVLVGKTNMNEFAVGVSSANPHYGDCRNPWDLTRVPGLHVSSVQQLLAEIGTDMGKFPTVKHFCSWLGLAPHNAITGGHVKHSHPLKNHNRAGQILRLAAQAVGRSRSGLGAYYRTMKVRLGAASAITATAHKLARILYQMLKDRQPYRPLTQEAFADQHRQREVKALEKRAARLGLRLQQAPATV
jgi:hypothetical protein